MNKRKYLYYNLILILFIIGCTPKPEVRFLEPQPKNKHDLKEFPKEYQGQYLSKSDSSILTIDSKMIYQEWSGISKVTDIEMQEVLDTIYKEDIKIEISSNWTMTIDVEGDSATIETYGIDTLFLLYEKTKLRKFKGYLFLNYSSPDSTWRVKILKLEDNQLDFEKLVSPSEIDTLREVTPIYTEIDTTTNKPEYHDLQPKRRELKEILERKVSDSRFVKIK
jgi:hypothetical protein